MKEVGVVKTLFIHGINTDEINKIVNFPKDENLVKNFLNKIINDKNINFEVDYLNYNAFFSDPKYQLKLQDFNNQNIKILSALAGIGEPLSSLGNSIGELIKGITEIKKEAGAEAVTDLKGLKATDSDPRLFGLYTTAQFLSERNYNLRQDFTKFFGKIVNDGKYDLIIGHSAGSLLSYYALINDETIAEGKSYLTFGSQISQEVFNGIYSSDSNNRKFPSQLKRWLNLYNDQDPVYVKPLSISNQKFKALTIDYEGVHPTKEHSIEAYFDASKQASANSITKDEILKLIPNNKDITGTVSSS